MPRHQDVTKIAYSDEHATAAITCGYCGTSVVAARVVAVMRNLGGGAKGPTISWLMCTNCGEPSVIDSKALVRPGGATRSVGRGAA